MNKTLLSLLAAASAFVATGSATTPVAEAGGIRLGFGVPLGAFVARPYAPDSYQHRGHSRRSKHHKSYAAARAEREARAAESARVRAARRAEKVRSAELARAEARAKAAKAEAQRELAKLNKAKEDMQQSQTTATVETGSTMPAAAPQATKETIAAITPTVANEIKAVDDVQTVATTTTSDTEPSTPQSSDEPTDKPDPGVTPDPNPDCKKFIPAVGVTISVGC